LIGGILLFHKRKAKQKEREKMGLKKEDVQEFIKKTDNQFPMDYIAQTEKYLRKKGYESIRLLGAGQFGVVV